MNEWNAQKKEMKLTGFEPVTAGSGIRRATNCAIASIGNFVCVYISSSGIRTRVGWVKTNYDNQLH